MTIGSSQQMRIREVPVRERLREPARPTVCYALLVIVLNRGSRRSSRDTTSQTIAGRLQRQDYGLKRFGQQIVHWREVISA